MKALFLVLGAILLLSRSASGDETLINTLKTELAAQKAARDYVGVINAVLKLRESGAALSPSMLFDEAEAYYKTGQKAYAYILLNRYLQQADEYDPHYDEARALLKEAENAYVSFLPTQTKALLEHTYIDSDTGLMWQDDQGVLDIRMSWYGAKTYCSLLRLAGHSDWRLPTYEELLTIVDYGRAEPAIKKNFINSALGGYWTATRDASTPAKAWYVLFDSGETFSFRKTELEYVRCVREDR